MCGIGGVVLKRHEEEGFIRDALASMGGAIVHRGPDSEGRHITARRGFVTRRLAIVDVKGGDQPIYRRGGELGIVYNGELYNYQSLRDALEAKGLEFATKCDTEVVLASFEEAGAEAFKSFEGMFGICIWDDQSDEVIVARDPFGIKPLYLYEDDEKFVFCSELKALMGVGRMDLSVDRAGVADYLTFRYFPTERTLFRRIRRLEPGTYARLSAGRASFYSFCDLAEQQPQFANLSFEEAKEAIKPLLESTVSSHLIGEVPIALLLSGGVDSSILAATLHDLNAPLRCFNVGFPDVNEFEYSNAITSMYGFETHNVEMDSERMPLFFDEMLEALDEPLADPAQLPLHQLLKRIREHATVILSGEGADELFGGYPQYWRYDESPGPQGEFSEFLRNSYYFLDGNLFLKEEGVGDRWRMTEKYYRGQTALDSMSTYDFKTWVPQNLMMKADKITMANSLEGRFPYLSLRLYEFARSLRPTYKISEAGQAKRILKEAYRNRLPSSVLDRPKMGFTVPVEAVLKLLEEETNRSLEYAQTSEFAEILSLPDIEGLFGEFRQGNRDLALRCWTLLVFFSWLRRNGRL